MPIPDSDDLGDKILPESFPTGNPAPLLAKTKNIYILTSLVT